MDILSSIQASLQPGVLLTMIGGSTLGIICGAIPGLTATMAVALVLPATFVLNPEMGLAMLLAVYVGATYGSSISAILLNIPGTPASMMTGVDGHPLARQGMAGKALGIATFTSFFGGVMSGAILIILAPILGRTALKFGPAEFFAIGVFALSLIAGMMADNIFKGLIAGLIGVFVGSVGIDPLTGAARYTFGVTALAGGLQLVPMLVGYFGFREVLNQICQCRVEFNVVEQVSRLIPTWADFKRVFPTVIRSGLLGTYVGILPGAGGPIASFMAYDVEQRINGKRFGTFGKGEICGVAASETANNGVNGGALIPLLTLGVPGDGATAVMLGAFMMQNIIPGPTLFTKYPALVNSIYVNYMISCVLMLVIGLLGAKLFMQVIKVPQTILVPIVATICFVGSYSIRNSLFDVGVMVAVGSVAFVMERRRFPVIAAVLGTILSSMIELRFRGALQIDPSGRIFFEKPICLALLVLSAILFIRPFWKQYIKGVFLKPRSPEPASANHEE